MNSTNMDVKILELIDGAHNARGLAVVIDVFRAFSTACYLLGGGVHRIIAVDDIERARKLKAQNNGYILIGERGGNKLPGFDYGNSPSRLIDENFSGETVVLTTSAGTRGLITALKNSQVQQVITGSFVNGQAVIDYIINQYPEVVSLIAMGIGGEKEAVEDLFCARYLKNRILQRKQSFSFSKMKKQLKKGSGQRFFDSDHPGSPPKDFALCLVRDKFDFVVKAVDYWTDGEAAVLEMV